MLKYSCWCTLYKLLLLLLSRYSRVRLCVTPETAAHQAPPSLGFTRQEHWSGLPFPSPMHESEKWKGSHSVVSNSLQPHGLQPTRLCCPWDFPGKSTRVECQLPSPRIRQLYLKLHWKFHWISLKALQDLKILKRKKFKNLRKIFFSLYLSIFKDHFGIKFLLVCIFKSYSWEKKNDFV